MFAQQPHTKEVRCESLQVGAGSLTCLDLQARVPGQLTCPRGGMPAAGATVFAARTRGPVQLKECFVGRYSIITAIQTTFPPHRPPHATSGSTLPCDRWNSASLHSAVQPRVYMTNNNDSHKLKFLSCNAPTKNRTSYRLLQLFCWKSRHPFVYLSAVSITSST